MSILIRLLSVLFLGLITELSAQELNLFASPPRAMLETFLKSQAFAALDQRLADYEKISTPEQIATWQSTRREFFLRQLGPFPARSPLNAQVTGQLDRGDFRIEKILFESQPHHHVTGLLYLPKSAPPYPGVLVPCGHSANGKASEAYQRICILLAQNGLAAFCYDPIGQGERAQLLKPNGTAAFSSTQEHTLVGIGAILLGSNTAQHRIWDGIRALDYLASRPEIDPSRLGCTGNSGGGTLTSYLMALDERIAVAAPACYPTTFRELLTHAGPQDAEQNLYGQIAFGLDIPDYTLIRAPKPTLLNAASRDQTFTAAGAWDLFRQAKRLYTRMGYANRVDLVEADAPHEFSTHLRVGAARWMRRWLLKLDDEITERLQSPILTDQEAHCSPNGQVMLLAGERSDFDLNITLDAEFRDQRQTYWQSTPLPAKREKVRTLIGARQQMPIPALQNEGHLQRDGVRIEKLLITPETGLQLPALAFIPSNPDSQAYLYFHEEGKALDARPDGPIQQLLEAHHLVISVDLAGLGETRNQSQKWYGGLFGPSAGEFYLAYLMGRSLIGIWTEEITSCQQVAAQFEGQPRQVHLIAVGQPGVAALHAAALQPDDFASVRLTKTLHSWAEVVRSPTAALQLTTTVHGALQFYDLPDLVSLLGSKLTTEAPVHP